MRPQRFSIKKSTLSDTIFTSLNISVDLHVSIGHFHSVAELCVIPIPISEPHLLNSGLPSRSPFLSSNLKYWPLPSLADWISLVEQHLDFSPHTNCLRRLSFRLQFFQVFYCNDSPESLCLSWCVFETYWLDSQATLSSLPPGLSSGNHTLLLL